MNHNIAFVDNERMILDTLKWVFIDEPYDLYTFQSPVQAIQELVLEQTAVVASDLSMPEMDGVTFLRQVKERCSDVECLLMTGVQSCRNLGFECPIIKKPWNVNSFRALVKEAVARYEAKKVV